MSEGKQKLRILIVEDAFLIGMDLKMSIEQMGHVVLGPVPSSARAMDLLKKDKCDAAILDVSLGRETSEPVADYLCRENVPFFFLTGYSSSIIKDPELKQLPLYHKPMNRESLSMAIREHFHQGHAA